MLHAVWLYLRGAKTSTELDFWKIIHTGFVASRRPAPLNLPSRSVNWVLRKTPKASELGSTALSYSCESSLRTSKFRRVEKFCGSKEIWINV